MKWSVLTYYGKELEAEKWKRWFAWYPVTLLKPCPQARYTRRAWLEWVERRRMYPNDNRYYYRLPKASEEQDLIEDGHGSTWSAWCPECGRRTMHVVRPGKVQCSKCG